MVEINPNQSLKEFEAELDKSIARQTEVAVKDLWNRIVRMNSILK